MAKAPFVCKLFGHTYKRFTEAWSSYQSCVRCGYHDKPFDQLVYLFEVEQWRDLVHFTGRSLSDLQNDQKIRDQVWEAVTAYRNKLC